MLRPRNRTVLGFVVLAFVLFTGGPKALAAVTADAGVVVHRVVKGDTLWALSIRHGTTVAEIASESGIKEGSVLRIGQQLRIPVKPTAVVLGVSAPQGLDKALASRGGSRGALALDWSEAKDIFATTAHITDVRTGECWNVVRRGGWAHADIEPATRADTETIRSVWGGWSWVRRPVVVQVGEYRIAASMAGMPHGGENVTDNGVLGHFDMHFLNSTTHGSEYTANGVPTVCPDHQAAVREATGK